MIGRLHSIQSLGTVDGPGVRAVAFLSGCPLRCAFCHNPDTWNLLSGSEIKAVELADRLCRFRGYFGEKGGVTLSGGEPLMQAEFSAELFGILKERGIHTALDTSGSLSLSPSILALLCVTDYVLLDVKFDTPDDYRRYTGADIDNVLRFLSKLEEMQIPTRIRRVVILTVNDSPESANRLAELVTQFTCVESIELLPFRKLCLEKYRTMKLDFPFAHLPEAQASDVDLLQKIVDHRLLELRK